jgi:hypothetical protein
MLKRMAANWRTTSAAVAALGVILAEAAKLIDGDVETVADVNLIMANLVVFFGFLNARDAQVTSEQSGAK